MRQIQLVQAGPDFLVLGDLRLHLDTREMVGPRGWVKLDPPVYAVADRLMRTPEAIVSAASLSTALRPHFPDVGPTARGKLVEQHIKILRGAFLMMSQRCTGVRRKECGGYVVEMRA